MHRLALLPMLLLPAAAHAQDRTQYVLAISWQPAFCESRPDRPECVSQTADRFDADHFALHGLWPQPRSRDYCGVDAETVRLDDQGDWDLLPMPELSPDLTSELAEVMPGTQSALDRHEWITHGTCYGTDAEEYFADSVAMLAAVNNSPVRDLFAESVGETLTRDSIRTAFDDAFGTGAGDRIRLSCLDDNGRRLIDEITIGLTGDIDGADSFTDRILDARSTDGGCDSGIVDPVGLQ